MSDVWVFGYGSLIWRPAFDHAERVPASIAGWTRRFWQHSTDHRGVPDAPGRVVTLIEEPGAVCHGMAYRVPAAAWEPIGAALDYREKGGYTRHSVDLALVDGRRVPGLVYVASEGNPNYAGPAPIREIASIIHRSVGPSGPNIEYLLELEKALGEMAAEDAHVTELADALRALSD